MSQVACHALLLDEGQEFRDNICKVESLMHSQAHTITAFGSCLAQVDMARILRPSFIGNNELVTAFVNLIHRERRK